MRRAPDGSPVTVVTAVALALALALTSAGCEAVLEPGRAIVLPITALDVPATVAPNDTLVVRATVQWGGCRVFERLEGIRGPARVTLTARGHDNSGPGINCTDDLRTTVREVRLEPPLADPFTVAARQPDGTQVMRIVRVQ